MKHNKCGHECEVIPSNFLKGRRCPECANKNRISRSTKRKTTEQFKQEVYDLVNNEYTVLGEYISSKDKLQIKHNVCGHEYMVIPDNFLSGNRCPKCAKYGNKKNTELFKHEVYNLVRNEYTVLGDYVNNKTKISMRHNVCGHEYMVRPDSFLKGTRCSICKLCDKKNTELFKRKVYDLVGDEYAVLGDYINNYTKILIKHNVCGNEYEVTPNSFLKGTRCPECSKCSLKKNQNSGKRKTTEQFKQEVYDLVGDEYTVLGDYINSSIKILMRHNTCGNEYEVIPNNFTSLGSRCPNCAIKNRKNRYIGLYDKDL